MERTVVRMTMKTTTRKRYRFRNFVWDCCMTILTGGLWLIWIFAREMRNR